MRPFSPRAGRRCREAADEGRHPAGVAPHPAPAAPPSPRAAGRGPSTPVSRWWLPVLDGPPPAAAPRFAYEIVVVGCSLGGMHALEVILDGLPRDFPVPIAIVQHRHSASNETLPSHFRRFSRLPVVDVEDKQWIRPGTVYLAPANYHLLVERGEFSLSVDEKVRHSRPSVDVLFQSAADAYGERTIAVVLTGANDDGARGVQRVKGRGGLVVVQDPDTAEAPQMPRAAIAAVAVDQVLRLDQIASYLVGRCAVPGPA